jgi:hypothetical protein
VIPPGYLDFGRACTRARGAAPRVFTVSFITCSIFGIFLDLDILEGSNEENEYRHSVVGLTVWSGRSFLCFGNLISSNPFLCKFHHSRLVRSLDVFVWELICKSINFLKSIIWLLSLPHSSPSVCRFWLSIASIYKCYTSFSAVRYLFTYK